MPIIKSEYRNYKLNLTSVFVIVSFILFLVFGIIAMLSLHSKDEEVVLGTFLLAMGFAIVFVLNVLVGYRIKKLTIDLDNSMFVISRGVPFVEKEYLPFSDVYAITCDEHIPASSFKLKIGSLLGMDPFKTIIYIYEGVEWFSFSGVMFSNYRLLVNIIKHEVIEKHHVKQI